MNKLLNKTDREREIKIRYRVYKAKEALREAKQIALEVSDEHLRQKLLSEIAEFEAP